MITPLVSRGSTLSWLADDSPRDRLNQLIANEPWMHPAAMARCTSEILTTNASLRVRYGRLEQLADRVHDCLAPLTPCRKGCHHCCSMVTLVYRFEAVGLAEVTGRKMRELPFRSHQQVINLHRLQPLQPCPFMVEGGCSVYADRPLICRLHHSLANDAESCRPLPSGQTQAPEMYDPDHIEVPYHTLVRTQRPKEPWGALTEFFPGNTGDNAAATAMSTA